MSCHIYSTGTLIVIKRFKTSVRTVPEIVGREKVLFCLETKVRQNFCSGFGGGGKVSHSLMSDMGEIVQEEPAGGSTSKPSFTSSTKVREIAIEKYKNDYQINAANTSKILVHCLP
jgi:hypothetical protein